MNLLALDLATKTGYADTYGKSGTHRFPFTAEEVVGARFCMCVDWLHAEFFHSKYDEIWYEQAHHRGGAATRSAMALIMAVESWAYRQKVPVNTVHTATLKKFATGSGKATKEDMAKVAMDKWPDIKFVDDNHVDALWVREFALRGP